MKKISRFLGAFALMALAGTSYAFAQQTDPNQKLVTNPSNKESVTQIPSTIEVYFQGGWMGIEFDDANQTSATITMQGPGEIKEDITLRSSDLGDIGPDGEAGFSFNVAGTYNTPGTYTFTVPANTFYLGFGWATDAAIKFEYNVGTGGEPIEPIEPTDKWPEGVVLTPSAGDITKAELTSNTVKISFANYQFPDEVSGELVTMTGGDAEVKYEVKKGELVQVDPDNGEMTIHPNNRVIEFSIKDADITKSGEYTFTADLSSLSIYPTTGTADGKGPKLTWKYNVTVPAKPEPVDANVDIAPKAGEVDALPASIDVTFKDETLVMFAQDAAKNAKVTGPEDYTATIPVSVPMPPTNNVTIKWDNAPEVAGEYTITLDPAQFVNADAESLEKYNPVVIKYTLTAKTPGVEYPFTYNITPSTEEIYDEVPTKVTVMFDGVRFLPQGGKWNIKVKMENEALAISEEIDTKGEDMMSGLSFEVPEGLTDPGIYNFTVLLDGQGEIYKNDGTRVGNVPDLKFNYTVGGITTRIAPPAGLTTKIEDVTITVTNAETVKLAENAEITFADSQQNALTFTVTTEANTIKVNVNPAVVEDGTYTLTFPAGSIIANNIPYNKTLRVEYRIKAENIEAIIIDGENADVFNIDGSIRMRNADKESLRTLEKGIYIVNGKKIIVK